jgi:hypothetical protein
MYALQYYRPVIDQNFYYVGLKYTGPTFACAMSNILPAMTFVMACIFRYSTYISSENLDKTSAVIDFRPKI